MRALRSQSAGVVLAVALVAGFVLDQLLSRAAGGNVLALSTGAVRGGWAWQPFTFVVLENNPFAVLLGALVAWSMGRVLEMTWGTRRVVLFALGVTALSGVLTVAASLAWRGLDRWAYHGGGVLTSVLWLAYGWSWGRRQTNFWGLPLSGNMLAGIGLLFVALNILQAFSVAPFLPHVLAAGLTWLYVRYGSPLSWWDRLRAWQLQRRLRARSSHLHVVGRDRSAGSGSDRYLH
jgi:hypothetical protein